MPFWSRTRIRQPALDGVILARLLGSSSRSRNGAANAPPSISRAVVQRQLCRPSKLPFRTLGGRNTEPNISSSAGSLLHRDRPQRRPLHARNDLSHSRPPASPQVVRTERVLRRSGFGRRESCKMAACEVDNMDVIAHRSAVAGVPIGPGDVQGGPLAFEDLGGDFCRGSSASVPEGSQPTGLKYRSAVMRQLGSAWARSARMASPKYLVLP
jgi:hypothetical protein